ncbi:MAG: hypothetical protein ACFFAN_02530 [Promethearchaeota archaeon]
MRYPQLFKIIIRVILLSITLSLSFVSFLGGLSALMILSDEDNIKIPDGDTESNLEDILEEIRDEVKADMGSLIRFMWWDNITDRLVEDFEFEIPFKIKNVGYFDLEDLYTRVIIDMVYEDVDGDEQSAEIYDKEKEWGDIERGKTLRDKYEADGDDLIDKNFPNGSEINFNEDIDFEADITISATYSLGLLTFEVELEDFEVFDSIEIEDYA